MDKKCARLNTANKRKVSRIADRCGLIRPSQWQRHVQFWRDKLSTTKRANALNAGRKYAWRRRWNLAAFNTFFTACAKQHYISWRSTCTNTTIKRTNACHRADNKKDN
jgi:hypothetical protein